MHKTCPGLSNQLPFFVGANIANISPGGSKGEYREQCIAIGYEV